jgi:hypothetical protein
VAAAPEFPANSLQRVRSGRCITFLSTLRVFFRIPNDGKSIKKTGIPSVMYYSGAMTILFSVLRLYLVDRSCKLLVLPSTVTLGYTYLCDISES